MSLPEDPVDPPGEARTRQAQRALISGAISDDSEADELPALSGTPFGDYVLERELGRGAFGVVYLARHAGINRHVALKRMRGGELATDSEISRFLQGAEAAAALDHPNIVPVFHVGERDGVPFFTMRYVEGKNLAEALEQRRPSEDQAIGWVAKIARAVQHAHDRGLIHLDLKPANILLDEADVPYVTDFGLARRLDGAESFSQSDGAAGAPYYMAPEQIAGERSGLTVRSDVYALGVILYELLTGEVPYAHLSFADWVSALVSLEPIPGAKQRVTGLNPDLDAVCAKALCKQPEKRYQSAAALADDLARVLAREPLGFRTASTRARLWSWVRRHRMELGTLVWLLSLLFVFGFRLQAAYRVEHEAEARQERENAAMASVQAVAFRFQLLEYAHRIARLAQQPEVIALLRSPSVENPSQVLIDRARGFDTLFVLGGDGVGRARTTRMPEPYMLRSFAFRDYFRGAQKLAQSECETHAGAGSTAGEPRSAYLARAHISESDGQFEFAISAPVCDASGWLGIIGGTIASNKVFGAVRLADGHPGRIAALLGPRDLDRKDIGRPLPDGFTFIVHPGLTPGREYQLQHPEPAKIRSALGIPAPSSGLRYVPPLQVPDYVDPVSGYAGQWSAAIAPVDASGFVVVVQSPRERARPILALSAEVALEVGTPFGVGLALLLTLRLRRLSPDRRARSAA